MPELDFQVLGAEVARYAASPQLVFKLQLTAADTETPIHHVMLQCQVRIEAMQRRYQPREQERLLELFGAPERWSQTLHSLPWTSISALVPRFQGNCMVDLPVSCSYDFNVAATKYFYALETDEIPLGLLFSGSIFYQDPEDALQIDRIPWDKEVSFRLPVGVWRAMMAHYYPNSVWLVLRQDVFDRLYQYKRHQGLATWEQTLERLLGPAEELPDHGSHRGE